MQISNHSTQKDLSFLLKSKLQPPAEAAKVMIHKRITKTFVDNTPDHSAQRLKKELPLRQRDRQQPQTRGESPLMHDLNSYIMRKDNDGVGMSMGKSHHIGMNPPLNQDELMHKLQQF